MYMYVYMYVCVYIYIYIYMCIYAPPQPRALALGELSVLARAPPVSARTFIKRNIFIDLLLTSNVNYFLES